MFGYLAAQVAFLCAPKENRAKVRNRSYSMGVKSGIGDGPRQGESFLLRYCLSSAAAAVSETGWPPSFIPSSFFQGGNAVTYPLDLVKTRLQIQGEVASRSAAAATARLGLVSTATYVGFPPLGSPRPPSFTKRPDLSVRSEGVSGLWAGISPAILRHFSLTFSCSIIGTEMMPYSIPVYSGVRVPVYEQLKGGVLPTNPDGSFPLWSIPPSRLVSGREEGGPGRRWRLG